MKKYITSVARTGLATLGGILVARGVLTPDVADSFVSTGVEVVAGVSAWAIAQVWSLKVWSKVF